MSAYIRLHSFASMILSFTVITTTDNFTTERRENFKLFTEIFVMRSDINRQKWQIILRKELCLYENGGLSKRISAYITSCAFSMSEGALPGWRLPSYSSYLSISSDIFIYFAPKWSGIRSNVTWYIDGSIEAKRVILITPPGHWHFKMRAHRGLQVRW